MVPRGRHRPPINEASLRADRRPHSPIDDVGDSWSYHSFSAFKRAMGPANPDKNWHHVVEQTKGNVAKFGPETALDFAPERENRC